MQVTAEYKEHVDKVYHMPIDATLRGLRVKKVELDAKDVHKLANMSSNEIANWLYDLYGRVV